MSFAANSFGEMKLGGGRLKGASGEHPAWAGARRRQTWPKHPPAAAVAVGRLPGLRSGRAAAARSLVAYGACAILYWGIGQYAKSVAMSERKKEDAIGASGKADNLLRPTAACMAPPRLPRTATLRSCLAA